MLFWPIFGNFWCPVVTLVTFSSNLRNFERNSKNQKSPQKNEKLIPPPQSSSVQLVSESRGGYPARDGQRTNGRTDGRRKSSCLIQDDYLLQSSTGVRQKFKYFALKGLEYITNITQDKISSPLWLKLSFVQVTVME